MTASEEPNGRAKAQGTKSTDMPQVPASAPDDDERKYWFWLNEEYSFIIANCFSPPSHEGTKGSWCLGDLVVRIESKVFKCGFIDQRRSTKCIVVSSTRFPK
jgi:hypothetical protein